jgi:Zn-dependent peptidase ImmA (M78 family)/formiminotetrahydrofolate cyclodeaminase
MEVKSLLEEYTTKELLEKFGKGSHKPGSGSAAAFQAMLAAKLIHTVIQITNDDDHRVRYAKVLPDLLTKDDDLTKRIYPALENLFQKDAVLFDRVIELRRKRNKEIDPQKKHELKNEALLALKPATEILIEIGDLCADVADYAAHTFDNAFQSAKGDSGMALSGAVAALGGCLSIIDLNLSSFGSDDWTVGIREQVIALRSDYNNLNIESKNRMDKFTETSQRKSFDLAKGNLNSGKWEGITLRESSIEAVADQATNLLWDFREILWASGSPEFHHEVLRPEIVIEKLLGYKFGFASLGRYSENGSEFQIAGQINKKDRVVVISSELNPEVRNFTIAHELGHALLHSDMGTLHRDRPLDGSLNNTDIKERQANYFAACFLMPAKIVRRIFTQVFGIDRFVVNQNTVFQIANGLSLSEFQRRYPDTNRRAVYLSSYKGRTFQPLNKIFGVSVGAMAIRLRELDLVE